MQLGLQAQLPNIKSTATIEAKVQPVLFIRHEMRSDQL